MELTIKEALNQAVVAHKEGNLQVAERLYRAIIQSQPSHPDANHNLGVLAVSVSKPELAIGHFKIAVETNPQIEQFWLSYIDALLITKQYPSAMRVIKDAKSNGISAEKLEASEKRLPSFTPALCLLHFLRRRKSGKNNTTGAAII